MTEEFASVASVAWALGCIFVILVALGYATPTVRHYELWMIAALMLENARRQFFESRGKK